MTANHDALMARLRSVLGDCLRLDEPLALHCSYAIGGPAEFFVRAADVATLSAALRISSRLGLPRVVLGGGSNLLVPDDGFRGLVVKADLRSVEVDGTGVRAGAGVALRQIASTALEHDLTGAEFCVGIPGTVGGALVMNAGAFGAHVGQIVEAVEAVRDDGMEATLCKEDLSFGYRTGSLKHFPGAIAFARFRLAAGVKSEIEQRMRGVLAHRAATQPLEFPSAGSVFKNPPGDRAGRLIERAGCKGWRVGDAEVSTQHANFIINRGRARYRDVRALIERVRAAVLDTSGVALELEVIDLGAVHVPARGATL